MSVCELFTGMQYMYKGVIIIAMAHLNNAPAVLAGAAAGQLGESEMINSGGRRGDNYNASRAASVEWHSSALIELHVPSRPVQPHTLHRRPIVSPPPPQRVHAKPAACPSRVSLSEGAHA